MNAAVGQSAARASRKIGSKPPRKTVAKQRSAHRATRHRVNHDPKTVQAKITWFFSGLLDKISSRNAAQLFTMWNHFGSQRPEFKNSKDCNNQMKFETGFIIHGVDTPLLLESAQGRTDLFWAET